MIDDLTFEYEGNQVIKVTDAEADGPYYKDAWHYRDGADAEIEREYDGNGNLVKDLDAGILRIEYNSLNLPKMIRFSDNSKHIYTYDATGKKLRAEYHTPIMPVEEPQVPDMEEEEQEFAEEEQTEWEYEQEWGEEWEMEEKELILAEMPDENGEVVEEPLPQEENNCKPTIFFEDDDIACEVTTIDYCGDFIYVNGKLKRMLFPGGYVTFRNDSIEHPEYHFYLTDHQGNIRVVANQNGEVEQVNHYYPYGGLMGESTNSDHQPYKYNGKELDRHHGLDWFDYGARWYNGYSWTTPDPLAEKYYDTSPYVYCADNPIKYIDPDGKEKKEYLNYNDLQKSDYSLYPENTPGVLNIWAHGLYSKQYDEYAFSIDLGNKGLVKNSQDFREKILKTSNEWQKSGGENITIVLHACGTSEFAKALSNDKMFKGKNITFIAPNAMLKTTTYRSGKKETRVKDKVYYNIKKGWEKVKTVKGKWMAYKDGKLVTIYPSNAQPGIDTMQDDDRINKKKKKK